MYKALDLWLPSYLKRKPRKQSGGPTDILFAICDHFEPFHGSDKPEALRRIDCWKAKYPKLIEPFVDGDGFHPRHTFFYPVEQYDVDVVTNLAEMARMCRGEVELHLHHEQDTPQSLREKFVRGRDALVKHKLAARDREGRPCYAFIHGNWALDDSHPSGSFCGVPIELSILRETGCYADFTMPSAPDPTQTRTINSIYYAEDTPAPKSHDTGVLAGAETKSLRDCTNRLLMVQGPLGLNWQARKFGLLPRIENGALTGKNPPRPDRMRLWMELGVHMEIRPDWVFIKLHTHGAIPENMITLLEEPMRSFYEYLVSHYNDGTKHRLHFVTAREMVNIIHAAEDGRDGNPGQYRDYRFLSGNGDVAG